jgi:hypothetical protein
VRVDRVVAGQLAGDVWVRTLGGEVGDIGQLVEGQPTFAPGMASLVFVRASRDRVSTAEPGSYGVVEAAQGQFLVTQQGAERRLAAAKNIGAVVTPNAGTAGGEHPRVAREVLVGKGLEDASREIAAAWKKAHGA